LRLTPPRPAKVLVLGLSLKLLVFPCASLALALALGAPPFVRQVAVLETAMPTMITAGAVIMAAGIASELVAAFVGWGLVLSLVTVPLWALVLR
jgi:malate permease and related proteins